MRTLLTGGAGFIGSNLADALLARGDVVTVLDNLTTGRRSNLDEALAAGAELVEGDIRDGELVGALFERVEPEIVLHLAAQIDVRVSVADPAFDASVNVGGTATLIEAARVHGAGRFVLISTGGAIYGEGQGKPLPFTEEAEVAPLSPYGQSKFAGEGYVALYERLYGISGVSLRLGNVYGPRQDPLGEAGVIAMFCGRIDEGRGPTVFGTGRQTRDYIYVDDVVSGILAAAGSDVRGAINLGTGVETDVLELAEMLGRLSCADGFDPEMAPRRPGEVEQVVIDSRRAAETLGWRAEVGIEEGLRRTLESLGLLAR